MRERRRCDGKGGGERRDLKGMVFVCRLCYVLSGGIGPSKSVSERSCPED